MQLITTKSAMRDTARSWRAAGEAVALVPTSSFVHDGHKALVARAKSEGARVVVSIFASPTPFGLTDDVATRSRVPEWDEAMLQSAGVDAVFVPSVDEMVGPDAQTIVETTELAKTLIGKFRPVHFRSVATAFAKLCNIVQPDMACFGEKDYQQLCVIRQMVRDLDMPVRVLSVPTVRDADGLALSTRNARLTPGERSAALALSRALFEAEEMAKTGITASRLRAWVAATLQADPRAELQSADIRDAETLATIAGPLTAPAVLLLAVRFGAVLLLDQRVVQPEDAQIGGLLAPRPPRPGRGHAPPRDPSCGYLETENAA
ncbi:pantoate--beta-alanine ligase [Pararhodobacter zhoushanensis]|uniref:Pantothenate synthetase n=1 Tax=Pararhodobacter zhoushanensis TaxID=2479545 RepID=A0ABT3H4Y2_9RHOB|nr:pantoate--beta-alanine ligase [Pararhodobacter zhoushanensis]MCW1934849.1 pantoate--beta-alanine ligase [Pararhodobacter zhoushanensis]